MRFGLCKDLREVFPTITIVPLTGASHLRLNDTKKFPISWFRNRWAAMMVIYMLSLFILFLVMMERCISKIFFFWIAYQHDSLSAPDKGTMYCKKRKTILRFHTAMNEPSSKSQYLLFMIIGEKKHMTFPYYMIRMARDSTRVSSTL